MVVVSAGILAGTRTKRAEMVAAALITQEKRWPVRSNSLERKPTCRATVAGATPGAAHCSGRLARITTHCTGAAGPRGLSNVNSLTAAR
jgi:hypothetical protein